MKVLFLSHYFPPEVNAPAIRTFEHCREWAAAGHEVHVITCVPSHPRGIPFPGYRTARYQREELEGIQVHRIWTYLAANQGVVKRTLNYASFLPSAAWRALRLGPFEVIIATSPQFFTAVTGYCVSRLKAAPWIFELRDLWPDSIAAVGAMKSSRLLRMIEKFELHMYRHAQAVVCLTHAFVENLKQRGITSKKLYYVPNGVEVGYWRKGNGAKVREKYGMTDEECLVSYIGTIGMAHGIHTILDCADSLKAVHPDVRFLVVGDGAELDGIREQVKSRRLSNVLLPGLIPHEAVKDYLAATDISLVLLRRSEVFLTVLPSKMFESMAAGKPIILGVEGEARRVLEQSGGGLAVPPENSQALAQAILTLVRDREFRENLGKSGSLFVASEFNRKALAAKYLSLLESICRGS
jgi:glycosyltransferase involved in cell wall biosynthesis